MKLSIKVSTHEWSFKEGDVVVMTKRKQGVFRRCNKRN